MPITIAGSGTITGISAGGLPDDSIIAADIATDAVTTAKIAASAVTSAKIADANITAAKLDGAQSGTAPIYAVRSWAVWNGSNGSVSNSGNCSSVSRSANGRYQFNFTTAMPSSNYVGIGGGSYRDGTDDGNAGYVTFRRLSTAAITTAYASLMSRAGGDWPDLPLSTFMVLC